MRWRRARPTRSSVMTAAGQASHRASRRRSHRPGLQTVEVLQILRRSRRINLRRHHHRERAADPGEHPEDLGEPARPGETATASTSQPRSARDDARQDRGRRRGRSEVAAFQTNAVSGRPAERASRLRRRRGSRGGRRRRLPAFSLGDLLRGGVERLVGAHHPGDGDQEHDRGHAPKLRAKAVQCHRRRTAETTVVNGSRRRRPRRSTSRRQLPSEIMRRSCALGGMPRQLLPDRATDDGERRERHAASGARDNRARVAPARREARPRQRHAGEEHVRGHSSSHIESASRSRACPKPTGSEKRHDGRAEQQRRSAIAAAGARAADAASPAQERETAFPPWRSRAGRC